MQNEAPLFRPAAIQAAAGTQIGEALVLHWRGMRRFAAGAVCSMLVLVGFAATVEYSPVTRVPAYTDARTGLARLSAPIAGQVTRIAVSEGAVVKKGALLAVLSSDRLNTAGGSQYLSLKSKLESEQAMLAREMDAANQEAVANHALLERRLSGLRAEQETVLADVQAAEQLLTSLQAQSTALATLVEQGYATRQQLAQKQDEARVQQSRLASSRGALKRIERDRATSQAEQRLIDARRNGVLESRRRAAGELDRLAVQTDLAAEQSIRAPIDGIVSTALIASGQSIAPGQALFTVAPTGEALVVRLIVPARAAATVRTGMRINVILSAYPQEKFGTFPARIESVSDTPSLPSDLQHLLPIKEPAFVAIAALPRELFSREGRLLRIKPGMLADALVPLERRTVLEWLFEPFLRGFNESAGRARAAAAAEGP